MKFGIVYPLVTQEKWNKVAEQYFSEKVIDMYPSEYHSSLIFAWTNYQPGKTREAEVLFNKVLLISPDDASALEGPGLLKK